MKRLHCARAIATLLLITPGLAIAMAKNARESSLDLLEMHGVGPKKRAQDNEEKELTSVQARALKEKQEKRIKSLSYELEAVCDQPMQNNARACELLQAGANPNIFKSKAPLIQAVSTCNVPLVKALLSAKADPNIIAGTFNTPLGTVIQYIHHPQGQAIATLLAEAGAKSTSNWYYCFEKEKLMIAEDALQYDQYAKFIKPLIRSLCAAPFAKTVLHALQNAISNALPVQTCRLIVSLVPDEEQLAMANTSKKFQEEMRIKQLSYQLEELCHNHNYSGDNNERAIELLEAGANPNIFRQHAPLIRTAEQTNINLLIALLRAKADPNIVDNFDGMPLGRILWGATGQKLHTLFGILLKAGAKLSSKWYQSAGGMRTVHDAFLKDRYAKDFIPVLRNFGMHPRTEDIAYILKSKQHPGLVPETIGLIIQYIPYQEDIGDAIEQHDLEGFEKFWSEGIDINARCLNGQTPLITALTRECSIYTNTMLDKILARQDLDFSIKSTDGRLPIEIVHEDLKNCGNVLYYCHKAFFKAYEQRLKILGDKHHELHNKLKDKQAKERPKVEKAACCTIS